VETAALLTAFYADLRVAMANTKAMEQGLRLPSGLGDDAEDLAHAEQLHWTYEGLELARQIMERCVAEADTRACVMVE